MRPRFREISLALKKIDMTMEVENAAAARVAELELELEITDAQIALLINELSEQRRRNANLRRRNTRNATPNIGAAEEAKRDLAFKPHTPRPLVSYVPEFLVRVVRRLRAVFIPKELKDQINLLRESDLFDEEWYVSTYPDTLESFLSAEEHYLRQGAGEGRDPSPHFSTKEFLYRNPQVSEEDVNPLLKHLEQGK